MGITLKELYENDANNIIQDLWDIYSVRIDNKGQKYIVSPLPSKEDFFDRFENGIQDPWDDVIDEYDISQEDSEKMMEEFKREISDSYEKVLKSRNEFKHRKYMQQEPAEEEYER